MFNKCENILPIHINRYVKQHYKNRLNKVPTEEHLGHPINAYHLVRHVVYGWEYILHHLPDLMLKNVSTYEFCK